MLLKGLVVVVVVVMHALKSVFRYASCDKWGSSLNPIIAEQPVDTPLRPPKAKLAEEKAVATLPKPSSEVRRPGGRRPLVRPTLERTEEPQADTDASAGEGSMVGQDKSGLSLDREISGGVAVLQPSNRKRLITSSQMIDNTSSAEANEANPPLKRPKEEESSHETSELKAGQPPVGDAAVAQVLSTDDQEEQSTEEMDTDRATEPIEEVEATKEDDVGDKDGRDTHVDASVHMKSQDTDADIDYNATPMEDALAKSEAAVQLFDENLKIDDLKDEVQLTTETDVDDEMEEGELPEEPEQALETTALEAHREPSDTGEQAGNVFSGASLGEPVEKNDLDISEIGEGDTTAKRAAVESDQNPITPSGGTDASPSRTTDVYAPLVREPSPNPAQTSASLEQQSTSTVTGGREPSPNQTQAAGSSEQQSTSTVADGAESRSTTINLQQRAILNRQARIQRTQQTARGRSQQSPQRVCFGSHHSC
jgi:nucleoprotein TPR